VDLNDADLDQNAVAAVGVVGAASAWLVVVVAVVTKEDAATAVIG